MMTCPSCTGSEIERTTLLPRMSHSEGRELGATAAIAGAIGFCAGTLKNVSPPRFEQQSETKSLDSET